MAEEILLDEARSECLIVLVTATSAEEATTLARTLVEEKLAACVSRFPVQSTYTWEGNIEEDEEWQLVIKTHRRQFHPLQVRVQALHRYEVPEIIALPIDMGSAAYLNWISHNVN
ncbi:divalent-cation tolerance protein CutA [Phormidium yuhuli AB48]|uniref:Divalent-cation tolerance protein CutA n=1 Tax=Phormidium yuhuli AB48 TaxID=2940671 RepID=A0ABY5AXA7_9CYAN|nr:divalent-cation tolerance protein CutA [Phormidium yuhuli]USR92703.1 divalent-cation tolerance protein CutA [Phormidium yuhuli AB48]